MELLIAIGHVLGALVVSGLLGVAQLGFGHWLGERIDKRTLRELSVELGVPEDDLTKDEYAPMIFRLSSARFSSELFRNRLSDLCGVIRTAWLWLGKILEVAILLGVCWYTFTDSLDTAIYAWLIVPVGIFFWIAAIIFAMACKLVTGRYPGQAKIARDNLAKYIASTRTS